mmetsp:Transcript_59696/g.119837  ORF Transcript_59696/g.119837 Transcript_59696/m.119837 type:complete len:208 (+) Transcript_59696:68-691(+)
MAGVLGIYGLIVAVILQGTIQQPDSDGTTKFSSFSGYAFLSAGLCCGLRYVTVSFAVSHTWGVLSRVHQLCSSILVSTWRNLMLIHAPLFCFAFFFHMPLAVAWRRAWRSAWLATQECVPLVNKKSSLWASFSSLFSPRPLVFTGSSLHLSCRSRATIAKQLVIPKSKVWTGEERCEPEAGGRRLRGIKKEEKNRETSKVPFATIEV